MVRATAYNLEVLHKKRLYSVKNEPFSLWTSLGLNQGPPDYESVALYGIEKLRFPMQPTELQVLCTSLLTSL